MIIHAIIAALLLLVQTPQAGDGDTENVFVDLGEEHCANEIAIAAYENTTDGSQTVAGAPVYVTYSAFQFDSAQMAYDALDDLHVLVAQTFSDDPDIDETENFDDLVTESLGDEEYGDRSVAYNMTLPVDDPDLDALFIDMLGVVEENQLLLVLMFSGTGTTQASPGLTAEDIVPFTEGIGEDWDGQGDLEEAIPQEEDMPLGWEGQNITTGELPTCEQQEQS